MKNDNLESEINANNYPLVTVLIPTYNRPYFLSMAIESVLAQTYPNIEIFISDNSPNEDTKKMMQRYLIKYSNIKYEHHPEYDFFGNWNRVQEYSNPKAEYINYLMDDDIFMPTKFEKMVDVMSQYPNVNLVTSYRMRIDEDNNILPDDEDSQKIYKENTIEYGKKIGKVMLMYASNFLGEPTTVLIRKSAFADCKLGWSGNEGRFLITDYPTWLKLLANGDMVYLTEPLSCFRKHTGQDTYSVRFMMSVPVCYAIEIKYAWDRKIFITEENEIKQCIFNCIATSKKVIYNLKNSDCNSESNFKILERLIKVMEDALLNGYNIDLSWLDTKIENNVTIIEEGIKHYIKYNESYVEVLFLGKVIPVIKKLLPNANIHYVEKNNSGNYNFAMQSIDIIIDNDYLLHVNNIRVFEPIYKLLKNTGTLLGIGYDNGNNDLYKDYILLAKYSLFDDFTVFEKNQTFVVQAKKFKSATLELKRAYTVDVRKKIARLLHRLEADLYINNSVVELAMLCEENKIIDKYINKFIDNTITYKNKVINHICYDSICREVKIKRVRDILGSNEYDTHHRIAFIICVNDDELYDEALLYLNDLIVPYGYGVEIIDVRNAKSMCSGYNRALRTTDAKYKVYIHQDTFIYNKNFINDILYIFKNKKIGCIGLAGCSKLPENAIWWRSDTRCGKVVMEKEFEECNALEYGAIKGLYQKAEALDGFLLATQYDIKWREDLFTSWHFYDISMCMEMKKRGYDVVVANQSDNYWALHCAGHKMLDSFYEESRNIFLNEYCK